MAEASELRACDRKYSVGRQFGKSDKPYASCQAAGEGLRWRYQHDVPAYCQAPPQGVMQRDDLGTGLAQTIVAMISSNWASIPDFDLAEIGPRKSF